MKVHAYYEFHDEFDVDIPNGENMTKNKIENYLYNHLPEGDDHATICSAYRILENGQEEAIFEY